MTRSFNMPTKAFREENQQSNQSGGYPNKIYRPLPLEAGSEMKNNIFVGLMQPGNWKLFSPTMEMAQMFDMNPNFRLTSREGDALNTWFMQLPVHYMNDVKRPDGSVGGAYVICRKSLNEQLVGILGNERLFINDRCACCEEGYNTWAAFNEEREALGYNKDSFRGDSQGYYNMLKNNPKLEALQKRAKKFRSFDRYILSVFDLDKKNGLRPLEEGQTTVEYQVWFAPKKVWESLDDAYATDVVEYGKDPFFLTSERGIIPVIVNKDTTKCSGNSLMQTSYTVKVAPGHKQIEPEWLTYLDNPNSMVDPSEYLILMTYDEMSATIGSSEYTNVPATAPEVRTNVGAPAVAPPTQAAPQPPESPAQAPVAPPAITPPAAPVPPTSPQASPQVPTVAPPPSGGATNPSNPMSYTRESSEDRTGAIPDFIPGRNSW